MATWALILGIAFFSGPWAQADEPSWRQVFDVPVAKDEGPDLQKLMDIHGREALIEFEAEKSATTEAAQSARGYRVQGNAPARSAEAAQARLAWREALLEKRSALLARKRELSKTKRSDAEVNEANSQLKAAIVEYWRVEHDPGHQDRADQLRNAIRRGYEDLALSNDLLRSVHARAESAISSSGGNSLYLKTALLVLSAFYASAPIQHYEGAVIGGVFATTVCGAGLLYEEARRWLAKNRRDSVEFQKIDTHYAIERVQNAHNGDPAALERLLCGKLQTRARQARVAELKTRVEVGAGSEASRAFARIASEPDRELLAEEAESELLEEAQQRCSR